MKARATMRPGQKGTKKLAARFGDRLLFVRYRYDEKLRKRFTTVELIVVVSDWTPPPPPLVRVKVEYSEVPLRREVKAAGGRWDPRECVWLLPLNRARELGLEKRISPH
jgi:hypothetical protein